MLLLVIKVKGNFWYFFYKKYGRMDSGKLYYFWLQKYRNCVKKMVDPYRMTETFYLKSKKKSLIFAKKYKLWSNEAIFIIVPPMYLKRILTYSILSLIALGGFF